MTDPFSETSAITLGGGCFWCLDAVFRELSGVQSVVSGYAGGRVPNPTYREVCSGLTGHAEVVQVSFDPVLISMDDLLRIFFTLHDPTTLNRQGGDVGTQYRSVIFYHDDDQRERAESILREFAESKVWGAPIVTELVPLDKFYPAEEYHQDYFSKNPDQPYCQAVVAPKVGKLRKQFFQKLRAAV
jgi:peptide-methionine (S)-S-oxide reductase